MLTTRHKNFWLKLRRPFFVLAPMANVTDPAFRFLIAKYGKPDVMFTQFVSADGLCSGGKNKLLPDLFYSESERPIVAQIFGANPKNIYKSAQLISRLGFNGLDINMGCPDKKVVKQGAGIALIKTPKLAQEIIQAAQAGAPHLPISVKTRLGYNSDTLAVWLKHLLAAKPAAITIHARTKKNLSHTPASWPAVKQAVKIAKKYKTLIIGNGDVQNLTEAKKLAQQTGADGIMIGRAIFGNPWLFQQSIKRDLINTEDKLLILKEHLILFQKISGKYKNYSLMKKHFKAYVSDFDNAKELRAKLMLTLNYREAVKIIDSFLQRDI